MSTIPHGTPAVGENMTATPSAAATITAQPEFGDFAQLRALFGIPRSTAYELAAAGEIKFCRLRKRNNVRGRVLIAFDTVRAYLARCGEEAK